METGSLHYLVNFASHHCGGRFSANSELPELAGLRDLLSALAELSGPPVGTGMLSSMCRIPYRKLLNDARRFFPKLSLIHGFSLLLESLSFRIAERL